MASIRFVRHGFYINNQRVCIFKILFVSGKNCHWGPKHVLFVLILKRKIGNQSFPSICGSLRRKNFFNTFWRPHTEKKFQSPLGTCLKKLISDPEAWLVITKNTDNLVNPCGLRQICAADVMQWKKLRNCSWFNFWSDGKHVQIAKCTCAKPRQKHNDFQHLRESTLSVLYLVLYF